MIYKVIKVANCGKGQITGYSIMAHSDINMAFKFLEGLIGGSERSRHGIGRDIKCSCVYELVEVSEQ